MNHTAHYRATLPHQIHPNQTPHLQPAFPGRFPTTNLENINAVMLPTISHQDHVQYAAHMQPFVNSSSRQSEHVKVNDQRKSSRTFSNDERERRETCQENYKGTSTDNQFSQQNQQHCQHGSKNCMQCFKPAPGPVIPNSRNKVMIDASTMTDPEEDDTNSNWQNVSVPTNTKVAEYLSSLRQFLKLSNPGEKKKKQLGDVRIMTGADGTRLFCCPECHVAYPDKSLLEPHLAGHKIERRWVCGVCGAGLKRKEHLDRHQLCHSDERPFACQACPKAFKRNEHLARHYVTHSGDKAQSTLAGTLCEEKINPLESFHKARFTLSVCNKAVEELKNTAQMENKLISHPNLDCSGSYSLHMPTVNQVKYKKSAEKKYMCGVCGTGHARREHLERHQVSHSEERPYGCPACGKAFKRNEHLARHVAIHSGMKAHSCMECGKSFFRKDHLTKHLAGHGAKRPKMDTQRPQTPALWPGPSRRQGSPPEGKPPGSSWRLRPRGRAHPPREVSRSPTGTGPGPWPSVKSGVTRRARSYSSGSCLSNGSSGKSRRTSRRT